jgi:hypothetical protein
VPVTAPAKVALAVVVIAVLALAGVVAWSVFNPAWNQCASYVDGRLMQHKCSEDPAR